MKLIVGLGNPGAEYRHTRHNIGFDVVEAFARKFRVVIDTHEKDAMTGRGRVAGQPVMVAMPLTYMNLSGSAVSGLLRAYLDSPADLLVVYDDVDLPLGRLRIRERGSAGTHNGMKSIVDSIGTEGFPRLRIGIRGAAAGDEKLRDYVLDRFEPEESEIVGQAVLRAIDALVLFARGDIKRAMNQFNREVDVPGEEPR